LNLDAFVPRPCAGSGEVEEPEANLRCDAEHSISGPLVQSEELLRRTAEPMRPLALGAHTETPAGDHLRAIHPLQFAD